MDKVTGVEYLRGFRSYISSSMAAVKAHHAGKYWGDWNAAHWPSWLVGAGPWVCLQFILWHSVVSKLCSNEWWIWKPVEGSGHSQIEVISCLPGRTEEYIEKPARIASGLDRNWTCLEYRYEALPLKQPIQCFLWGEQAQHMRILLVRDLRKWT
jgi:hypothetical protein